MRPKRMRMIVRNIPRMVVRMVVRVVVRLLVCFLRLQWSSLLPVR